MVGATRSRSRNRLGVWLAGLIATAAAPAWAQDDGFLLARYRAPASLEDGFARALPETLGSGRFSLALTIDYAHDPLVLATGDDLQTVGSVVDHQVGGHLAFALGLGSRLQVSVLLPATLSQSGDSPLSGGTSFDEPESFALADPSIGAAVAFLREQDGPVRLGLELAIPIPVGSSDDFASDDGAGVRGEMLFSAHGGPVTFSLDAGVAVRPERDFDTVEVGPELLYGAGLYVDATGGLMLGAELFGATGLRSGQAFDKYSTPLELLGGIRYMHASGFTVGAAGAAGLTPAPGVPDFRVLGTIGFALPRPAPEPPPAPPPPPPPPAPSDRDGDGLMDPDDRCPDEPEDRDQFEDEDGCPDPDNDRDTILDPQDQCPNEPEDRDQFEDENGCPDPDNDQDTILDPQDQCPNEPESRNGVEDEDGCPDAVRIEGSQIRILQKIEFEFNRDVIRPESFHILEEVTAVLGAHPEITRVRVEGHTDDRGNDRYNLRLSGRRADSVKRWLVEHGIAEDRLEAEGLGETRPIADNHTNEGRQQNRRVEFHIVGGPQAAPAPEAAPATQEAAPR